MYKMHIISKITIFILMLLVQIGLFNLILAFKTVTTNNMTFSRIEFNIVFFIVSSTGTLLGIFFLNIFRSWTPESIVEKMENIVSINNLILSLQQKKILLINKTPTLKNIDSIQVYIEDETEVLRKKKG